MDKKTLGSIEAEYSHAKSQAERLCAELVRQLEHLLRKEEIALGFPLQYRVKTWLSIADKYGRVPDIPGRLGDLQDLVGLRIILLFSRDVERVSQLIEKNFNVERRYLTQDRLKEDQFGYASVHFVVSVPDMWVSVPTLEGLTDMLAEIQIRTVAQHLWAEASQSLQYKQEQSVPIPVRRAVARVAAMLEVIDLEFERVLTQREEYRASANATNSIEPLNVDVLETTLDSFLPSANKNESGEKYSILLRELNFVGIEDRKSLFDFLNRNISYALEHESQCVSEYAKRDRSTWSTGLKERVDKGVWFYHTGMVRAMLKSAYPQHVEKFIDIRKERLDKA